MTSLELAAIAQRYFGADSVLLLNDVMAQSVHMIVKGREPNGDTLFDFHFEVQKNAPASIDIVLHFTDTPQWDALEAVWRLDQGNGSRTLEFLDALGRRSGEPGVVTSGGT